MKKIKLTVEVEFIYVGPLTELHKIIPQASDISHSLGNKLHMICVENAHMCTNGKATFKLEEVKPCTA